MLAALGTAWRTVAFGLSFGRLLLASLARAGIGLLVGLLVFTVAAELAPPYYRGHVRSIGAVLTALAFGVSTFLKGFLRPVIPDVMGSAAWASPKQVAATMETPALAADPAALLVGRGYGHSGPLLRYAGPAHLLTIAPTRFGKEVGTILPNLLEGIAPSVMQTTRCVNTPGTTASPNVVSNYGTPDGCGTAKRNQNRSLRFWPSVVCMTADAMPSITPTRSLKD